VAQSDERSGKERLAPATAEMMTKPNSSTGGHASLTTTSQYLHVDDDRQHRETGEKHRIHS
jgi:hypothetical protein